MARRRCGLIESGSGRSYPAAMTSIVVADDHAIVREGLQRLLEAEPGRGPREPQR